MCGLSTTNVDHPIIDRTVSDPRVVGPRIVDLRIVDRPISDPRVVRGALCVPTAAVGLLSAHAVLAALIGHAALLMCAVLALHGVLLAVGCPVVVHGALGTGIVLVGVVPAVDGALVAVVLTCVLVVGAAASGVLLVAAVDEVLLLGTAGVVARVVLTDRLAVSGRCVLVAAVGVRSAVLMLGTLSVGADTVTVCAVMVRVVAVCDAGSAVVPVGCAIMRAVVALLSAVPVAVAGALIIAVRIADAVAVVDSAVLTAVAVRGGRGRSGPGAHSSRTRCSGGGAAVGRVLAAPGRAVVVVVGAALAAVLGVIGVSVSGAVGRVRALSSASAGPSAVGVTVAVGLDVRVDAVGLGSALLDLRALSGDALLLLLDFGLAALRLDARLLRFELPVLDLEFVFADAEVGLLVLFAHLRSLRAVRLVAALLLDALLLPLPLRRLADADDDADDDEDDDDRDDDADDQSTVHGAEVLSLR